MSANAQRSTGNNWEDSISPGQASSGTGLLYGQLPGLDTTHTNATETFYDEGSNSPKADRAARSRHRSRSSQKLSNELHFRSHVTRDSLVVNLLNTFDQLPGGQGPSTEQVDPPSNASNSRNPGEADLSEGTDPYHFPGFSSYSSTSPKLLSDQQFDPYKNRSTPIRPSDSSHKSRLRVDRATESPMESPSKSRSSAASRPTTAVSTKSVDKKKKKSKGSEKSLDQTEALKSGAAESGKQSHSRTSTSLDSTAKTHGRRRSRTNPPPSSILNRARPVPVEYHDFDGTRRAAFQPRNFSGTMPQQVAQTPPPLSTQDTSRRPSSSRNRIADLTGLQRGLAENRNNALNTQNSRQPSTPILNADLLNSSSPSPSGRNQALNDSARGKQGFFRRMFGSSGKLQAATPTEQSPYLLPPLHITPESDAKRSGSALSGNSDTAERQNKDQRQDVPNAPSAPSAPSAPPEIPAEQPHVIHKKTSFFRRKKRTTSIGNEVNDPKADTQNVDQPTKLNSPSVSSLREVMSPFLGQTAILSQTAAVASPVETTFYDSRENQSLDGEELRVPGSPRNENLKAKAIPEVGDGLMIQSTSSSLAPNHTSGPAQANAAGGSDAAVQVGASGSSSFLYDSSGGPTPAQKSVTHFEKASKRPEMEDESSTPRPTQNQFSSGIHAPSPSTTDAPSGAAHQSPPVAEPSAEPSLVRVVHGDDADEEWVMTSSPKQNEGTDGGRAKRIWLHPSVSDDTPVISVAGSRMASVSSAPSFDVGPSSSPPISPVDDETPSRSLSVAADSTIEQPASNPEDLALARQLFDGHGDALTRSNINFQLGQSSLASERLRQAYMALYDFGGLNILLAMRDLCSRLALRGESQQVDRILAAFAQRWVECNPDHGFKNQDVVHTMCYSLLLLNTDLHIAELDQKMTRSQFVRNTLETIRQAANDPLQQGLSLRVDISGHRSGIPWRETRSPSPASLRRPSLDIRAPEGRLSLRPSARPTSEVPSAKSPSPYGGRATDNADLLVNAPYEGSLRGWEALVETVLKEFYLSIRQQRLPLFGGSDLHTQDHSSSNSLAVGSLTVSRRPSAMSKSPSEGPRRTGDFHGWNIRNRSKQRMYQTSAHGSSRTSFDEGSVFSPNASSTWSRSFGRGPTSMSSDSVNSHFTHADYGFHQSVGFASALSHAIIREEDGVNNAEEEAGVDNLLDDESLELEGAPWAKEGILQHKHHMESAERKAKDRNWNQCFAVVDKGCMRLFSFNSKASMRSQKSKALKGGVVGGGNWMDNAEAVGAFTLRQTIANTLPAPGYSKSRPHVFALVLPTGAVHLFHVGTPEIAKEFVSTANYWSARLSKEPLVGGVSNIEYGWSENVINTALLPVSESTRPESSYPPSSAAAARTLHSPSPSVSTLPGRPSFQGSLRGGSIDLPGRARLPGDRVALSEWVPPQQSLSMSALKEKEQLEALRRYVGGIEEELTQHNELRPALLLTYSVRHPNATKAMANWERKSSYLLREIVKFRTYIDALVAAETEKERVYKERAERLAPAPEEDEEDIASEGVVA